MNANNMLSVAKRLRHDIKDREFRMSTWMVKYEPPLSDEDRSCGTAACLAGHACLDAAVQGLIKSIVIRDGGDATIITYDIGGNGFNVSVTGQKHLGLDEKQSYDLFQSAQAIELNRHDMADLLEYMVENDEAYPVWFKR